MSNNHTSSMFSIVHCPLSVVGDRYDIQSILEVGSTLLDNITNTLSQQTNPLCC
jgi:hypothetical protein